MSRADGIDLDRLADYAAGTLDASAAADVARLVRSDDRWARALDALVAADEAVRADLRDLSGSEPAGMPADVAARIEHALREVALHSPTPAEADQRGTAPTPAESDQRGTAPTPAESDRSTAFRSVTSLASARAARQRKRQRYLTGAGAAAATLVLVLCGVAVSKGGFQGGTNATSAGDGANQPAPGREGPAAPPAQGAPGGETDAFTGPLVLATGSNYTQRELSDLTGKPAPGVLPQFTTSEKGAQPFALDEVPPAVRDSAPEPLARLTAPDALASCLAAIRTAHPGVPILIDYARYEGRPALIVSVRMNASTTVVAVGPNCGVAGPDEIASATVP